MWRRCVRLKIFDEICMLAFLDRDGLYARVQPCDVATFQHSQRGKWGRGDWRADGGMGVEGNIGWGWG